MDLFAYLMFMTSFANVALLAALFYPALKNLQKTRSSIAGGLLLFIALFLADNVTTIAFHLLSPGLYSSTVESQDVILTSIQTASFATLLWITLK